MTLEQVQALTDDEIRVRVGTIIGYDCDPAEAREWGSRGQWVVKPGAVTRNLTSLRMDLPNYPADLNACAEAVNSIPDDGRREKYLWALKRVIMQTSETQGADEFQVHTAPPRARCEAFLAVMQP